MDPRKKKEESLKHDRRNTYGENDKSSRKSIRRHKRLVNQIYRHKVKQALASNDATITEDTVAAIRRPGWKKHPDQPLGEVMLSDLMNEMRTIIAKSSEPFPFEQLEKQMAEDGWEEPGIRVVVRQLKATSMYYWSSKLNLDLKTARKLIVLLKKISVE